MTAVVVVTTLACDWRDPVPLPENPEPLSEFRYVPCEERVTFETGGRGALATWPHPVGDDSNNVNARRALTDVLGKWHRSLEADYCPEHARIVKTNLLAPMPLIEEAGPVPTPRDRMDCKADEA